MADRSPLKSTKLTKSAKIKLFVTFVFFVDKNYRGLFSAFFIRKKDMDAKSDKLMPFSYCMKP